MKHTFKARLVGEREQRLPAKARQLIGNSHRGSVMLEEPVDWETRPEHVAMSLRQRLLDSQIRPGLPAEISLTELSRVLRKAARQARNDTRWDCLRNALYMVFAVEWEPSVTINKVVQGRFYSVKSGARTVGHLQCAGLGLPWTFTPTEGVEAPLLSGRFDCLRTAKEAVVRQFSEATKETAIA